MTNARGRRLYVTFLSALSVAAMVFFATAVPASAQKSFKRPRLRSTRWSRPLEMAIARPYWWYWARKRQVSYRQAIR